MKLAIIIGKDGGPHAMENSACIPPSVLKGFEDGDEVTAKVSGTIVERDGKRYINISEVDGKPVEENDDEGTTREEAMDMDSEDALTDYMNRKEAK